MHHTRRNVSRLSAARRCSCPCDRRLPLENIFAWPRFTSSTGTIEKKFVFVTSKPLPETTRRPAPRSDRRIFHVAPGQSDHKNSSRECCSQVAAPRSCCAVAFLKPNHTSATASGPQRTGSDLRARKRSFFSGIRIFRIAK